MKTLLVLLASLALSTTVLAQSDPVIASVQQTLKDQGFYYGEITGRKDTDTTAAIRRFQIRNGLQVTGDLNAETQKSLGIKGGGASTPRAAATPPPPRAAPSPDTSDLVDEDPPSSSSRRAPDGRLPDEDLDGYAPGPRGLAPETSGLFDDTPYAIAPPDVQRRVLIGVQTLLARRGYYRSAIDGEFGPGTAFALRAFQSRYGLPPTGRLDMDTLAALGLLPGQRAPGVTAPPRQRYQRPPQMRFGPNGEPIFEPRPR